MSGPFGNYERATMGDVLNSLCEFGVPLTKVEQVTVCFKEGIKVSLFSEPFAELLYIPELERPLIRFFDEVYMHSSVRLYINTDTYTGYKAVIWPMLDEQGYACIPFSTHTDPNLKDVCERFMKSNPEVIEQFGAKYSETDNGKWGILSMEPAKVKSFIAIISEFINNV